MNRTIARLSLLLVVGACVSAACGGKVVFDSNADGVSTSGSSSSSSGGGAGSGGSTGAGGCDAASHTIDYKNYNLSCTMASDCIPAFLGNLCGNCTCALASINGADKTKYEAESQAKAVPPSPGGCFCPANKPVCTQGQCSRRTRRRLGLETRLWTPPSHDAYAPRVRFYLSGSVRCGLLTRGFSFPWRRVGAEGLLGSWLPLATA